MGNFSETPISIFDQRLEEGRKSTTGGRREKVDLYVFIFFINLFRTNGFANKIYEEIGDVMLKLISIDKMTANSVRIRKIRENIL